MVLHRHLAEQIRVSSDELASDVQSAAKYSHPPLKKLPSDRDRRQCKASSLFQHTRHPTP